MRRMTLPFWRTVTVRHTSFPLAGHSTRCEWPARSVALRWVESPATRMLRTVGALIETERLFGTLYSLNVT
jgi:hypothetical protein